MRLYWRTLFVLVISRQLCNTNETHVTKRVFILGGCATKEIGQVKMLGIFGGWLDTNTQFLERGFYDFPVTGLKKSEIKKHIPIAGRNGG